MEGRRQNENRFSSPDEELRYLREQVAHKERELESVSAPVDREKIISEQVKRYEKTLPNAVLTDDYEMKIDEIEKKVLSIKPEHEKKLNMLVDVVRAKGIKNAMSMAAAIQSPHIDDDFHRFLVQYLAEGMDVVGLKSGGDIERALNMRLYEITLPEINEQNETRKFAELVSVMEHFYFGMISVREEQKFFSAFRRGYFTLELALSNFTEEAVFYAAVPRTCTNLFEKQILATFPNAVIREHKEDYNPFNENGVSVGAYAASSYTPVFPLKTYEAFEHDPLNIILGSFSKIKRDGEAAAIQIVIAPRENAFETQYRGVADKIKEGIPRKNALEHAGVTLAKEFFRATKDLAFGNGVNDKKQTEGKSTGVDEEALENIKQKTSAPIFDTNVRLIASAENDTRAEGILDDLMAAFNQFGNTHGNRIVFKKQKGKVLEKFLHCFSFRLFSDNESFPLNTKELTTMFHFPVRALHYANLKQARGASSHVPLERAGGGIILGVNHYQGTDTQIRFSDEDRMRHFYCIGQTGTGKTTLLKNMIAQDIVGGKGVCMIDPHGTDIVDVLGIIPRERVDDVIYFDPAYVERPMGLNMLEYNQNYPEQKTFVVNELFSIFQKLYGAVPESMGPMFEQYFRNATMLVIEDPKTGNTLLDVSRVMADAHYRDLKLSRCRNPVVVQFWREVAQKAGGEASLANMVPYITSKFDVFLANEIMRPIIAQEHSAFNFREIMDNRKILLVNLSKGRLGDINSSLIGLILVGKILMAALSRVDAMGNDMPDFYLYIDEFQNVTTNSIATILSEARKYRLSLNIAHQFIAQIQEGIRDAVFGNVGSMAVFRVGADDAKFLESQFTPTFAARDIMNLQNHNAYLKMLVNGTPANPFNIETFAPSGGNPDVVASLKELSYLTYGRDRAEVEAEVAKKYSRD